MNILRLAVITACASACTLQGQTQNATKPKPATCAPIMRMAQDYVVAKGMPYSGTRIATCEKAAPDGSLLKGKKVRREWRDAEGRTRREEMGHPGSQFRDVRVTDPVDHVVWSWMEGRGADKTVIMWHYKLPNEYVVYSDTYAKLPDGTQHRSIFGPRLSDEGPGWKIEKLTSTYVNGVWAEGIRDIRIAQPGEMNNHTDLPQTIIGETWAAVDLKEVIVEHTNDPGLGKMTDDLVKIDRSDPDPTLFRPPANYRVLESHPYNAEHQTSPLIFTPANPKTAPPVIR